MQHQKRKRSFFGTPLLLIVALFLSSCGTAPAEPQSAAPAPASSSDTAAKPVEQQSNEQAAASNEAAATSGEFGATVTSDEDVTTPRANRGGEYRQTFASDGVILHPYLRTDVNSYTMIALLHDCCLLRYDEQTLELIPHMAQSYTISADGLTFTFQLRPELMWSDGQPLTAHDFQWTYEQASKPENEYPALGDLAFIQSYKALDDSTLEVKIGEVFAPALYKIAFAITPLPKHIWETLDWKDPAKNSEINQPTVVSGPYQLTEWNRDQNATFAANEKYWRRGAPNIDRIIQEIVPSPDIAFEKLKNGEVDTAEIQSDKLNEARQLENVTMYEWWPVESSFNFIGFNMRPEFAPHDVKVRQAVNYAIDKEAITAASLNGEARRLCSTYPSTSWVYNPDVPCYDFDPDKATALLQEAGYTLDGDKMVNAQGEPLKLKIIYAPVANEFELAAVSVQDYLGRIGVEVEVQSLEWGSFLDAITGDNPDWDMYVVGWGSGIEPDDMKILWLSDSTFNVGKYQREGFDDLWKAAAATYDNEVRKAKYQEIQQIIAEDTPFIFLFYGRAWSGQNKRVQGIEPTALGIGWNTNEWYVAP